MEKSLQELRHDSRNSYLSQNRDGFKCQECDETFHKPLLARVSSQGSNETYYACPNCLSKVRDVEYAEPARARREEREPREEEATVVETIKKAVVAKPAESPGSGACGHFLGYLRQRPRETPFPDECLTCDKMIECLT